MGSLADSLADYEFAARSEADSTMVARSKLCFGFGTSYGIEGCFQPTTSQSIEGKF